MNPALLSVSVQPSCCHSHSDAATQWASEPGLITFAQAKYKSKHKNAISMVMQSENEMQQMCIAMKVATLAYLPTVLILL